MKLSHLIKLIIFIYFCSFSPRICFNGNNLIKEIANMAVVASVYLSCLVSACDCDSVLFLGFSVGRCLLTSAWIFPFWAPSMNANRMNEWMYVDFGFNILAQEIQLCLLLRVSWNCFPKCWKCFGTSQPMTRNAEQHHRARHTHTKLSRYVNLFCVTRHTNWLKWIQHRTI